MNNEAPFRAYNLIGPSNMSKLELTDEEWAVLRKLLLSKHVEFGIGAELEGDLTEKEDDILWGIITRIKDVPTG